MTSDDKKANRFAAEQIGEATGAALGAIVADAAGAQPVALAFAAVGGTLGTVAGRWLGDRVQRRAPLLGEGFSRGSENADAPALTHTVDSEQIIVETVRSMMGAVDDSVVPTLGYLAGRYMLHGRRPDVFFRGWVERFATSTPTTCGCSATSCTPHSTTRACCRETRWSCSVGIVGIRWRASAETPAPWSVRSIQHSARQAFHLWQLLTRNGLAEASATMHGSHSPDTMMQIGLGRVREESLDVVDAPRAER